MTDTSLGDESLYLLPRAALPDYMRFMTSSALNTEPLGPAQLENEWHAAQDAMNHLFVKEAGWADRPIVQPLPPALRELGDRVLADPLFKEAYGSVNISLGMVELDRVIVSQRVVSRTYLNILDNELGADPSPERIFHFCLPLEHPQPDCQVARISDGEYTFTSKSHDLRFLGPRLLSPAQRTGIRAIGPIASVLGLVVGFSANCLNLLAIQGRLVLKNGTHRACALRARGMTHAPVLIQQLSNKDEMDAIAQDAVCNNPDFFLKSTRPPVLKDYFDRILTKEFTLPMTRRQVRVTFSVEQVDMPSS